LWAVVRHQDPPSRQRSGPREQQWGRFTHHRGQVRPACWCGHDEPGSRGGRRRGSALALRSWRRRRGRPAG